MVVRRCLMRRRAAFDDIPYVDPGQAQSEAAMESLRRWTAIAYRRHDEPHWHEFEPAPLTIAQARLMVRKGLLLMAQKRLS